MRFGTWRSSLLNQGVGNMMSAVSSSLRVHCYSGRKADERPVRFELGGRDHFVEEITDCWYGPSHAFFKVRTDDGNLYILIRPEASSDENWQLESLANLRT